MKKHTQLCKGLECLINVIFQVSRWEEHTLSSKNHLVSLWKKQGCTLTSHNNFKTSKISKHKNIHSSPAMSQFSYSMGGKAVFRTRQKFSTLTGDLRNGGPEIKYLHKQQLLWVPSWLGAELEPHSGCRADFKIQS